MSISLQAKHLAGPFFWDPSSEELEESEEDSSSEEGSDTSDSDSSSLSLPAAQKRFAYRESYRSGRNSKLISNTSRPATCLVRL